MPRRRFVSRWVSLLASFMLLAALANHVIAAPGDLDPAFGVGGYISTHIVGGDEARAVAVQTDGKIIAVGRSSSAITNQDFQLVRYTASGSPDGTFGVNGAVTTAVSVDDDTLNAVALQADGKIVVAGSTIVSGKSLFAVARYLSTTGALDAAFGVGGIVTTSLSTGDDEAFSVVIQPDQKIVVAGSANAEFAVARYTVTGTLDTDFSGDGLVVTPLGSNDIAHAVLLQPDGKIILAGESDQGNSNDFAVARYTTNGSLDTSFHVVGYVTTDFQNNTNDLGLAAALQPDGKIVVAGFTTLGNTDFALARYTANGYLDTTFNSIGWINTPIGLGADEAHAVAIQASGKIVAAGFTNEGAARKYDFVVVRYLSTGGLDTTFGASGIVSTTLQATSDDLAYGLALQPDQKILVAGSIDTAGPTGMDFAVARYLSPNATPAVSDLTKAGLEDTPLAFAPADFTAHFTDADGDLLAKIKITTLPVNGELQLNGVNVTSNQEINTVDLAGLTFAPATNWNGGTSFTWNGSDGISYAATGATVNLTINAVNDAPSFNPGTNQAVLEDANAQAVANWATNLSAGPANENGQTLNFFVSTDNSSLFSAPPLINALGTLTFTPAVNANGSATITVTLHDNGGTANGGVDTSASHTFQITVAPVNDRPTFTSGADQLVAVNAGAQVVTHWATAISPGPVDEGGQNLTFVIATTNNGLFQNFPHIDPSTGDLSYAAATGQWGLATVTATLKDSGGTANGGVDTSTPQTFTITIRPRQIFLPLALRG